MSTSHANTGTTATKPAAGTTGNVTELMGSTAAPKAETKDSSAKKAAESDAKAPVSDTKGAVSSAKTPNSGTKTTEVAEKAKELIDSAIAAAGSSDAAPTEEMVNIKMLRSHPRLAYAAGNEGSIPRALYDELLVDGPFFEEI